MLYELALARGDEQRPFKAPRREGPPATVDDLERLFADAEAALRAIDFFKTRQVEGVMRTLREVLQDRKSTHLNSSHGYISYAVFCLKKKKQSTRNLVRR